MERAPDSPQEPRWELPKVVMPGHRDLPLSVALRAQDGQPYLSRVLSAPFWTAGNRDELILQTTRLALCLAMSYRWLG